jgi:predicted acyltransferase
MSQRSDKVKQMILWGIVTLVAGFALDFAGITPIIKRIATSSFTLASLGWCLLGLAGLLLVDRYPESPELPEVFYCCWHELYFHLLIF